MVIIFFVAFFQPWKSFQKLSAFLSSQKESTFSTMHTHAYRRLVEDSLLDSKFNSLLLWRLGNTSLLGNGYVVSNLLALRDKCITDSVSTEHPPVSRSSLFQSRPLELITVTFVSGLWSTVVWHVTLLLCDSLPLWLERRYNSNIHMCTVLQTTTTTVTAALQCAQYFPGKISTLTSLWW